MVALLRCACSARTGRYDFPWASPQRILDAYDGPPSRGADRLRHSTEPRLHTPASNYLAHNRSVAKPGVAKSATVDVVPRNRLMRGKRLEDRGLVGIINQTSLVRRVPRLFTIRATKTGRAAGCAVKGIKLWKVRSRKCRLRGGRIDVWFRTSNTQCAASHRQMSERAQCRLAG